MPSTRRRKRLVPAASGLAALVIAAVFCLLLREGSRPNAGDDGRAGDSGAVHPSAAHASPSVGADQPGLSPAEAAAGRAAQIPVGVRLAGPGRLVGRVVDRSTGLGVPEARVDLLAVPPAGRELLARIHRVARFGREVERRSLPVATVRSGPDGGFAFEGVRTGSWFVDASGEWHASDEQRRVRVSAAGDGGPVDVFVRPGGRIVGRVVRPLGAGVSGVTVFAFGGPGRLLTDARNADLRLLQAGTDADGSFVLSGVASGEGYDVSALGPALGVSHLAGIAVEAGRDTQVTLVARTGATLEGQVLGVDSESGVLRPIEGAHLGVVPRGLRDLHFAVELLRQSHVQSDAQGRYRIEHAAPGELDVIAYAPGFLLGTSAPVLAGESDLVRVEPLVLSCGPSVTVHVSDGAGQPLAEAVASWWVVDWKTFEFRFSLTPFHLQGVEGFDYPSSDAQGVLVVGPFPGEPPHRFVVWKHGFTGAALAWDPGRDPAELEVRLLRGGAVEGVVVDAERAEPVTSFTILGEGRIEPLGEAPDSHDPFCGGVLVEDPAGRFHLDGIETGPSALTFVAEGYLPTTLAELAVQEGEVLRGLIVDLRRGGTLRGRVLDARREPVAGAQVLPAREDERPLVPWPKSERLAASTRNARANQDFAMDMLDMAGGIGASGPGVVTSGPDGSFTLHSLPEGPLVVLASHRDHARGRSEVVRVRAGEPIEGVEVLLSAGGGIEGAVRDRHGRALTGEVVCAFSTARMDGELRGVLGAYQDRTGADGSYRITGMEAGSYLLTCVRADDAIHPASLLGTLNLEVVSVPEAGFVHVDLVDSSAAACRIHGRVLAEGRPVSRGVLFALSFEDESLIGADVKLAQVQADGTYAFAGLPPGLARITFRSDGPDVRLEVDVPDEPEVALDLVLPGGRLRGRVVEGASGETVAAAIVTLARASQDRPAGLLGVVLASESGRWRTTADGGGRFEFTRLQAGEYVIGARPPERGPQLRRLAASKSVALRLTTDEQAEDLRLALEPAIEIRGIVVTGDGAAIDGADVTAWPRETALLGALESTRVRSDGEGRFTLPSLGRGSWDVVVSARGFADPPPQAVELGDAAQDDLRFVLVEGLRVSVLVLGPDGLPVAGASARLEGADAPAPPAARQASHAFDGALRGRGLTGADGRATLGRVQPGRYRLLIDRGERHAVVEDVEVEDGPPLELTATLP
jgi:hypothetical protein